MLKSKEKEGVEGKEKLPNHDLTHLRNSKINPRKTSEELKRDWDESGVHVSSSTTIVRKRSEKAKKEPTVARRNKKETIQLGQKNTKTGLKMIGAVSSF